MKIGILTLPLWYNYGGIIQAYALQEVLIKQGHEVSLIDYHHEIPNGRQLFRNKLVRFIKRNILRHKNIVVYPNYYQKQQISRYTLEFIKNEIHLTNRIHSQDGLVELNSVFDAFIVGSDQVWRPNYTPNIQNYFLDFTKKTKIAYSASFGTDNWMFSEEEHSKCKFLIKEFKAVSVREKSGVSICRDKFGLDAVQVLDPTMLLSKDDYINLCEKYETPTSEGNLFTYILDESDRNKKVISEVSSELKLEAFRVMPKTFDNQFRKDDDSYVFPPLKQWLKAFDDAKFVVTDSFHGCVFSIIFNKPFIAIGNYERGLSRFNSLLDMFDLKNRLVTDVKDITKELLSESIDWNKTNKILETNRTISLDFLKSNVS